MGLCIRLIGMVWCGWQKEGSQPGLVWPQAAVLAPGNDEFAAHLEGWGEQGTAELSPCSPQAR